MANDFSVNIPEGFDLDRFANEITQQYLGKGFQVRTMRLKNSVKLVFDKKCGGINYVLGLGQGITATCTLQGKDHDILSVSFSNGDWIGKIIGGVVGLACCITFVTAIIGTVKQLSLPSDISDDMQMVLSNMEE